MKREAVEVVVVGAGAAGLAAADALVREGIDVVVLEARSRVGGRILTSAALPPLEHGAEFLPKHGAAAGLLAAAGGVFSPVPNRHARLEDGELAAVDFEGAMAAVGTALTSLGDSAGSEDRSLEEVLERARSAAGGRRISARDTTLVRRYVEQYHAAPVDAVSARWVADIEGTAEGAGGGEQLQCLDGLDRLPRLLAADLPSGALRLGTEVMSVTAAGGGVRVVARDGAHHHLDARWAIVTVPVTLLAAGVPRLEGLSEPVRAALGRLRQGRVVKLGLRFRHAFWRERLTGTRAAGGTPPKFLHADPPFPTWWTSADLDAPTLVGWAGAGAADALAGLDRDALLDAAAGQLAAMFSIPRPEVRRLVEAVAFHDWCGDPWTRGAYTYALPGGAGAASAISAAPSGPILLAGEAVSSAMGTVDGALSSGWRAARRVLGSFS